MIDEKFMARALGLAKKGVGRTSPNPAVGCVVVKNNKMIGSGYHKRAGMPHAEVEALKNIDAAGTTMYVTLEPCCHWSKTPPCTKAIIEAGVKRVVIAMQDPNPKVSGKGIQELKNAGIDVEVGLGKTKAQKLNEHYIKFITTRTPFITLKSAMTLDGKIATRTNDSKYISNEKSRMFAHKLRSRHDAVLVGINTIINDNPLLTCRLARGKNPIRIILDSSLRIPLDSNVLNDQAETIIVTTQDYDRDRYNKLIEKNIRVIIAQRKGDKIDLNDALKKLAKEDITSILVEGGSTVNGSFFDEELIDRVYLFISPKLIGGEKAKPVIGGEGIGLIKNSKKIKNMNVRKFGDDILIEGYL